ncbi:FdtA/QdtA family cupin domain-containing protein [Pontixanthobacter gangjinensis]|uniref:WxcM-like domain-containing protein n=1 Tax=Christiangramia aestuarii TaxID=1028746 RepID=A0A7M3SWT6_9FLAO|nr:FdtA/QdtA family cupin domain-containing protein [Christiangramia aestuarii]MUP41067.1 WxcM-like domain-containing protein [Christiangramia aestuarii]
MKLKNSTVFDCSIIQVAKVHSKSGNITVLENGSNIPFDIKRIYYLYDIPGGESRGGHAHYELEQYVIAASGSFNVILDDGVSKKNVALNRPDYALHIVPGLWRELKNFSSGAICLVMASHKYDENDYVRDYSVFKKLK